MTTESGAPWAPPRPPRPRRAGRIVYWVVFGLIAAAMIGCAAGTFLTLRWYRVGGASMQNTLRVGDSVWVSQGQDVRRGDIVAITAPNSHEGPPAGTSFKRVIGLPGDHVACCDASGDVAVNGTALDERAYLYPGVTPSESRFSATVPSGWIWVMGDDRKISYDSRWYGPVPLMYVTGRVIQIDHSPSGTNVATPTTFVADGLAPPDHRRPLPFLLLGAAVILFIALLLDGALGIVLWALRRRRLRRQAPVVPWPVS